MSFAMIAVHIGKGVFKYIGYEHSIVSEMLYHILL